MKIELKNIHHSEQLSEETNAFTATLYINGIKAGTASNRGHGGPTDYHALNDKGKELIKQAEEYCKKLPSEKFTSGEKEYVVDMDLELFIDQLLNKHLQEKDLQKFRKKVDKAMEQCIVIGVPDQSFKTLKFKMDIGMLLVHPNGPNVLKDAMAKNVIPNLESGEMVLNTNIPEQILKEAGLKSGQYVAQETIKQKQKSAKTKGRKL
jgi:hypothetical protein